MPRTKIREGLRLSAAGAALLAGSSEAAFASNWSLSDLGQQEWPAKVELISSSRLGCDQGLSLPASPTVAVQCAFDDATRGARILAKQDYGTGSIEVFATVSQSSSGAFTPDQLLTDPRYRSTEATNFLLAGFKGSALDNRLKMTAEFARTDKIVDALLDRDWAFADRTRSSGTSALVRLEATLADRPGFKWSMTGEFRSVSDDYSVGRGSELQRHFAMPGSRLALSSRARIGQIGLSAGVEKSSSPFGESLSRKAGADWQGISFRLATRDTQATPLEGSTLLDSHSRTTSAYLDLDTPMIAASLLPALGDLPAIIPTGVSLSYRSGQTEYRYPLAEERFLRSSLGIEGTWETPIGETTLGYWTDRRDALTPGASSWAAETMQVSHFFRRGNWRFGVDASLDRTSSAGTSAYADRTLSFGHSIAYSAPKGPEFRFHWGQDRSTMHFRDDSYASADCYSSITASLDLSRYLQAHFERPDLRLTLDYRKALARSDSEMHLLDELVEHWVDSYRREGLLMSFGMKL